MLSIIFQAIFAASIFQSVVAQVIQPTSVPQPTRDKWCDDQKSSCPLICLQLPGASGTPKENNCDPGSLVYSCVCSNGQVPNSANYSLTIPYHECQTAAEQCQAACPNGNTGCYTACNTAHQCGASNPTRYNITSSSSVAAAATSGNSGGSGATGGSSVPTGFGGSGSGSTGKNAAGKPQPMALGFGQTYGLITVLVGISGGFFFML